VLVKIFFVIKYGKAITDYFIGSIYNNISTHIRTKMLGTLWTIILIIVAIIIIVVLIQFLMGVLLIAPVGVEHLSADINYMTASMNPLIQIH
jgi:uncharacterized membrane protein